MFNFLPMVNEDILQLTLAEKTFYKTIFFWTLFIHLSFRVIFCFQRTTLAFTQIRNVYFLLVIKLSWHFSYHQLHKYMIQNAYYCFTIYLKLSSHCLFGRVYQVGPEKSFMQQETDYGQTTYHHHTLPWLLFY